MSNLINLDLKLNITLVLNNISVKNFVKISSKSLSCIVFFVLKQLFVM